MEVTAETLIIGMVVLGAVALTLIAWLLRYFVRGRRKEDAQEAEPAPAGKRATKHPDAPPTEVATSPPAPAASQKERPLAPSTSSRGDRVGPSEESAERLEPRPGETLLMQVWQDREGFLVVEVQGQRYRRLFDIRDGAIGRGILETINRLVAFSKGKASHVTPAPAPNPEAVAQEPATSPPAPPPIEDEASTTFLDQLKPTEQEPKKSRLTLDPVPFRRRSAAYEANITLNLAAEIDQWVQRRVKAAPEFGERHIRVTNAPDGGLCFTVDGLNYDGLEEIPDPQVQALIRAAISDWEAKR